MTNLFQSLIKNPTVRAYVLATVRHLATAGGAALAANGFGNADTTQALVGLVIAVVSWYFSQSDVKGVDKKVNALAALAPNTPQETITALKNGKF